MSTLDLLLPRPASVTPAAGTFAFDADTTIHAVPAATWLANTLRAATGLPLPTAAEPTIRFDLDPAVTGYRLTITPNRVHVIAADPANAHHAAETIRQLLGPDAFRAAPLRRTGWALPCGTIEDRPAFGWRGCLLDVARTFLPKAGVLRFVDQLAAHKLNVLHLHLTDDQGWRIEVPDHPRLTEIGSWRTDSAIGHPPHDTPDGRPHGGFYTTDDLREIVAYAADRAITVVPEIDIPGHSQAAITAYPKLGNLDVQQAVWTTWGVSEQILNPNESTVDFVRSVFDHVLDVFPSPVIGIGGDEVPTTQWADSPAAQHRAAELGLPTVSELHGWFVTQIADHLAQHGRRALGWEEIGEFSGIPTSTVLASWRGEEAGIRAARAGYDVVMCPEQYVYLDHRQSDHPDEPIPISSPKTIDDVYGYRPVPAELAGEPAADRVLGAQAQVWSEHLDSARRIDYAAFPRLAAFAEVVWTPENLRNSADFHRRLTGQHLARLDALGIEYRPLAGPHPWQRRPGVLGR